MEETNIPKDNDACVMMALGELKVEKRPVPQDPGPFDRKPCEIAESEAEWPWSLVFAVFGVNSASVVLCGDFKFAAADGFNGTLQGFFSIPEQFCYKLPANVSMAEGALIEPLAIAVMAVHSVAKMPHNVNVAVLGAGPVGLLTMAVAKALGARRILAIDIQSQRLEFAKQPDTSYGPGCYALAVDLVRQGRINLNLLITHQFSFKDASEAFKTTKAGVGPDGKMAIKTI
ncbi:hypothetical protein ABOM_000702, partial [Aspergillus bombycis]